MNQQSQDSETQIKTSLQYDGSLGWLIFWIILCFPVALVMFFTAFGFQTNERTVVVRYNGSRFWLCFWTVFMFPIALILAVLNGFNVIARS